VKSLCSSDIPRILEQVEIEPQSKESHEFLETIWSFISNETGYDASAIHGFPVYLARKGANYSIISPESFEKEPAILAPSTTLEFDICGKIPGLYLVQESTFPKSRVRGEMLQSAGGLMRFTRALSQLAFKAHQTLESYVRYILSDLDLAVLRQLYIAVLGNIDANGTTKYRCILTMLRQLPLWENANGKLIPAINGILLPHPRLFLPWLDICEKLLIPIADSTFEKTLAFLGLRLLDPTTFIRQFLVQNICQHKLCEEEVEQYASFLSVVLQLILVIPIEWPLACDGGLRYRKINELYDHRNPFFRASLRGGENEKFLHTKLQRFWDQNNGLRADATAHDYVNAAKQIQIRGLLDNNWKKEPDTQLQGDAQTVYQTLCLQWDTMKDEPALMERLLRICFIPTKRKFTMQPRFRMIRMQSLANRRPFNCFQELVLLGYVDICWSQVRSYSI